MALHKVRGRVDVACQRGSRGAAARRERHELRSGAHRLGWWRRSRHRSCGATSPAIVGRRPGWAACRGSRPAVRGARDLRRV